MAWPWFFLHPYYFAMIIKYLFNHSSTNMTAHTTLPRKQWLSTGICQERTTTTVCKWSVGWFWLEEAGNTLPPLLSFGTRPVWINARAFVRRQEFKHKFTHERTSTHTCQGKNNERFSSAGATGDLLSARSQVSYSVTHERYPQIPIQGSQSDVPCVTEQIYLCTLSLFTFFICSGVTAEWMHGL